MEIWFNEIAMYAASGALMFIAAVLYLLVIGPRITKRTNRGNRFLYYGRHSLLYFLMSLPSLVYVTMRTIGIPRSRGLRVRGKLHQLAGKAMGVKWETRNEAGNNNREDDVREAVVVINHQLWADFISVWGIHPPFHRLKFVMKNENVILFPYILEFLLEDALAIDRSNGSVAYKMLESAVVDSPKTRTQIVVFPEGTRNRDCIRWSVEDGRKINDFKSGAFRAAINAGVPIQPVVISPYHFIDEERLIFGQGKIILKLLPKISTKGLKFEDAKDLLKRTHKVMSEAYEELKEEIMAESPNTQSPREQTHS